MSEAAYTLIGLTAVVAALVGVLTYAVLRFAAAARDLRRQARQSGGAQTLVAAAFEEAVSRLRAQERALAARAEASERLSDEIVASLTAGLLVVGLEGAVRTLNPAGRRLLQIEEPAGSVSFREALANAPPLVHVIEECLTTGRPVVRRALEIPRRDGAASHLGVTVSPLHGAANELHGAICLFTDLTAVVDLEEQLRLKDSLARLGELTAGLAHEFRNGLATIHGYSRLFDLEALPRAYRPYVEGIRQETDALGQIVTNFLNFARPAQLVLGPVDLAGVAERAADELRPDARSKGGDIVLRGEFPTIDGDEVLLRQALSNLLRNALEACEEVGVAPRIAIEGQVDRANGVSRLSVIDNGRGIDPALGDRIFRPFFTSKRDGTGLGLALVQKIVVTHNGRITVGAAPGRGASLQIVLPLAAQDAGSRIVI